MPTAASSTSRSAYLDFLKGMLIFLVVWGHAIQFVGYPQSADWRANAFWSDPVFKLIYLFHMPLFIAVSGFLCHRSIQRKDLATITRGRFRQLVVPIIAWGIAWPLFLLGLAAAGPSGETFQFPAPLVLSGEIGLEIATRFWFLWAVFAGTVLVSLAHRARWDHGPGLLAITIAFLFLPDVGPLPMMKYTVPFFFVGYLLRHYNVSLLDLATSRRLLALAIIGAAAYFLWTPATYVYTNGLQPSIREIPRILFIYTTGAVVSGGFLFLSHRLYQIWQPRWIAFFGRRSLDIYIFQTFIFLLLLGRVPAGQGSVYFSVLIAPLLALAVCSACVLAGGILERIPGLSLVFLGRQSVSLRRAPAGSGERGIDPIDRPGEPMHRSP